MSWTKLTPIVKTTGRAMASASIVVNKDGIPKVSLILSATLTEEFGTPTKADVSAGEGDNLGAVLLEFHKGGAFDVKRFVHGGSRIFLPVPEGLPDKPAANVACTLGERSAPSKSDGGNIVIRLPTDAWAQAIASRLSPARAHQPEPPPKANGGALDMVEYLKGKGVKIERLAGGRFQMNGETIGTGTVLRIVNDHRKQADLDPLALVQVH